jgi:hypothetical protein
MFSGRDGNNGALFRLLWPLVVEQLLGMTIGLADIMMMSAVGEYAVSGVSLVDTINILIINIFAALATGGAVVSSQYIGRRDTTSASRSARQLVYITLLVSLALMLLALPLRRPLLKLIYGNIPPEVMGAAEIYFRITALSYPFIALYNACAAVFCHHYDRIMAGTFDGSLVQHLDGTLKSAYEACTDLAYSRIYHTGIVTQIQIAGFKILATLLKEYIDAILKPGTYYARNILSIMPEQYKVQQDDSLYTKIQTVTDYVSGMTDSYALNLYRKIKGIDLPEIR